MLLAVFSFALAFAPSWPVFTALFFMMGAGQISSYVTVFVLGMCLDLLARLSPQTLVVDRIGGKTKAVGSRFFFSLTQVQNL